MNRLLFAAARGARIVALDRNLGWIASSHAPLELSNDKRPYRIHPDDEHLQYGPISSALREIAAGDNDMADVSNNVLPDMAVQACFATNYDYTWIRDWRNSEDLQTRSLFLLILSECLADEGL